MTHRTFSPVLLAAALAACAEPPELDEVDELDELDTASQALAPAFKAQVKSRTLTITGNAAASRLALRLGDTASTLEVDVGDDGSAEWRFDRTAFERIAVDAGGGDDVVRVDESRGAFTHEEQTTLAGGGGNDTLRGGVGVDTLHGGAGNDTVDGGYSADTITLGNGDDVVVWAPGSASDVIAGDGGHDTLRFGGAGIGEVLTLTADGDRLRLTRDVAAIVLDVQAVEVVELAPRGGADRVVVGDLAAALVAQVTVDLAGTITGDGDALSDVVVLEATPAADAVAVWSDAGAVVTAGPYTELRVSGGEPTFDRLVIEGDAADQVAIHGSPGADEIRALADPAGAFYDGGGYNTLVWPAAAIPVTLHGQAGDDVLSVQGGVNAPLVLDGGDGNDTLQGAYGAERLLGGPGDDTFYWHPGGGSDVVEGEAGADTLVFNASNAGDVLELRDVDGRLRLSRQIGTSMQDVAGVERVEVVARGSADTITILPLGGTEVAAVDLELGGADAAADRVVLDGSATGDAVTVTGDAAAVTAVGLGATVTVRGGEPALDRLVVHGGALTVAGTDGPDTLTVFTEDTTPVYDGGFAVPVSAGTMTPVRVEGRGGDDALRPLGGVVVPLTFDGGDGDDTLHGGYAADTLVGGAGDDTFSWDPGNGSDVLEGGDGADRLAFTASGAGDIVEVRASGDRAVVYRNIGSVTVSLGDVEAVAVAARAGTDTIVVRDLTGTAVTTVDVDLAGSDGLADAVLDTVAVLGTTGSDAIAVTADAGAVVVSGLAATVRVAHPDTLDALDLHGAGGADTITATPDVEALIRLTVY